jgi:aromatic-L-amino-acid/L-tryptophan decarboxylase
MDPAEFRRQAHALVDWMATYLEEVERYPVLARVAPGDVRRALPSHAPEEGEPFEAIAADVDRVLLPALTHWNHPGFMAYFASSGSPPGILGEMLAAAFNQQAMLWKTSPAATELEETVLGWLRELLGLPAAFEGVIYDTASISTLHALAAARERTAPDVGAAGLPSGRTFRVYASEHTHSSVDKALMLLGLGRAALRRIPADRDFRMQAAALAATIDDDLANGVTPMAVVATIGTTSTTSVDPIAAIAAICEARGVWLHVDAAYAGTGACVPELRPQFAGWERADSIVVNPHKWLFTPMDLSVLYCRHMPVLHAAFSLVPEFLRTAEGDRGVRNLMDTGIQLGRRFRSLKLWMVLRTFGAAGVRALLREHVRLASLFASWVDADPRFERVAPVPFSVVCFRVKGGPGQSADDVNAVNEQLMERVNATGEVFLSHTRLDDRVVIRLAIGHYRTSEKHVARAWAILRESALAGSLRPEAF